MLKCDEQKTELRRIGELVPEVMPCDTMERTKLESQCKHLKIRFITRRYNSSNKGMVLKTRATFKLRETYADLQSYR